MRPEGQEQPRLVCPERWRTMSLPDENHYVLNRQNNDLKNSISATQRQLIDRLADYEQLIAELYAANGLAFPEMSAFWQSLAREEKKHVSYLKSLHGFLDDGKLFFNLGSFDEQTIEARSAEVCEALAAVNQNGVSGKAALETALSLEKSILESKFYDVAKSDAPEFSVIADHLSKDTRRHIEQVEDQYRLYVVAHRRADTELAPRRPMTAYVAGPSFAAIRANSRSRIPRQPRGR